MIYYIDHSNKYHNVLGEQGFGFNSIKIDDPDGVSIPEGSLLILHTQTDFTDWLSFACDNPQSFLLFVGSTGVVPSAKQLIKNSRVSAIDVPIKYLNSSASFISLINKWRDKEQDPALLFCNFSTFVTQEKTEAKFSFDNWAKDVSRIKHKQLKNRCCRAVSMDFRVYAELVLRQTDIYTGEHDQQTLLSIREDLDSWELTKNLIISHIEKLKDIEQSHISSLAIENWIAKIIDAVELVSVKISAVKEYKAEIRDLRNALTQLIKVFSTESLYES